MSEYVYFIHDVENDYIKIGYSKNPLNRLRYIKTTTGNTVELLSTIEGNRTLEKQLHQKFAKDRVNREWFKASDELLNLIDNSDNIEVPLENKKKYASRTIKFDKKLIDNLERQLLPPPQVLITMLIKAFLRGEVVINLIPGKISAKQTKEIFYYTCPDCNSPYIEKLNEVNLRCESCGYHFGVSNDPA